MEIDNLKCWLVKEAHRFVFATQCSGTDSPFLAWQALEQAMAAELSIVCRAQHGYACEKDEQKRDFLRRLWPAVKIFVDSDDLANDLAMVHEGTMESVPVVSVCTAGFPLYYCV